MKGVSGRTRLALRTCLGLVLVGGPCVFAQTRADKRPGAPRLAALARDTALRVAQATSGQAAGSSSATAAGSSVKTSALVVELRIDDIIHPLMAEYLLGGFDEAVRRDARLILITVNTPGGLDSSMREIIQRILKSPIPVAVYVSPSGARAASAGFYILLSADIAAMAPGTATGAASPVFVVGGAPVKIDETLHKKVINDASAYLRSIAGRRGRNVDLAEKAVTEARAYSEKEALEHKLLDVVAPSVEDLLVQLDGREITRFDGSKATLELRHPVRTRVEMTGRQKFLSRILHPDIFFVLLIVGVLGLYAEFTNPGLIAPGVIGGISLVLALFAMNLLPVNATGLLLIVLAIALFILEAKFTSHGVLGFGGVVAMVLGALMLIKSPMTGMGVSLGIALAVTIPFALITVFLMQLVLQSMRWRFLTGVEGMIGMVGEVTAPIDGRGMVFVHGELWRATSTQRIPQGAQVRVVKVDGLTVHVEPVETPQAAAAASSPQN